ncbi:MAG: thiosulfate oxidation carrier complex protein SoxZ [Woeseiaceae bacterium]
MASKIKVKTRLSGDVAEVKSLIVHPMETGARKDPDTGELVPRHHITQLRFINNGEAVMVANFSTAVSKNPYINFRFAGAKAGDTLNVSWVDNLGDSDEFETVLS